jgi:uncharacterized RDD family membrane protein YckC
VSNTDEKEKQSHRFDDSLPDSPTELLQKELVPETTLLGQELSSTEASPFLSALSKPEETAPARPAKTYPMPQRRTVFFGESEVAALEEEFQSVTSPKPPSIPSQRVSTVPPSLPIPTPEALNAQAKQTEQPPPTSSSGVLGVPSETLLSTEDHGGVADPSETLSALLDEVFSEEVLDFDFLFPQRGASQHGASDAPTAATPPPSKKISRPLPPAPLPEAPPWDPIATMAAHHAQTQTSAPTPENVPPAQPPAPEFVIPSAHASGPSTSLFEETTEMLTDTLSTTQTELVQDISFPETPPAEAASPPSQETVPSLPLAQTLEEAASRFDDMGTLELSADEMASEFQKTLESASQVLEAQTKLAEDKVLQEISAPLTDAPSTTLAYAEQEAVATTLAAQPIFHLSSPPSFVDPENRPAAAVAPTFHPLEKTHEAVPASLPRLLGAFAVDALLLCLASLCMLWAAKAFMGPNQATLSLSSAASWQIWGPTTLALLASLMGAYATFFAVVWNGSTPGRKLLGLRLVNKEGHGIGFLRAFLRSLFSLLSFGLALSGFWWALIDKRRQTFHDKCTGTFVVHIQPKQ